MEYYINPMWFYFLGFANHIKLLCGIFSIILFIALVAWVIAEIAMAFMVDEEDDWDETVVNARKKIRKFIKPTLIAAILFMLIDIALPSKETMIEMMIARQVTPQNVEAGVEAIKGAVDYVIQAIQNAQ